MYVLVRRLLFTLAILFFPHKHEYRSLHFTAKRNAQQVTLLSTSVVPQSITEMTPLVAFVHGESKTH